MVAVLLLGLGAASAAAQTSLAVNRLRVISAAGSATESCQNLRGALAAITDATAESPYVLRLEPGRYDCGAATVVMKPHVDLEGSGEGVTRIVGHPEGDPSELGVVDMADQTEIRFLTVEHSGSSDAPSLCVATAVSARSGESRITRSTLVARAAGCNSCGLFAKNATVRIVDSRITGDLDGLFLPNGTATVEVHGSAIEGTNDAGVVMVSGDTVRLVHSQLINGFDTSQGGDLTCLYSYDGSLAELGSGCL